MPRQYGVVLRRLTQTVGFVCGYYRPPASKLSQGLEVLTRAAGRWGRGIHLVILRISNAIYYYVLFSKILWSTCISKHVFTDTECRHATKLRGIHTEYTSETAGGLTACWCGSQPPEQTKRRRNGTSVAIDCDRYDSRVFESYHRDWKLRPLISCSSRSFTADQKIKPRHTLTNTAAHRTGAH